MRARRARLGHWPARTGDVVRQGEVLRDAALRFFRSTDVGAGALHARSIGPGAFKVESDLSAWVDRCSPKAPVTLPELERAVQACDAPMAIDRDVLARAMLELEAYADAKHKLADRQRAFLASTSLRQACQAGQMHAATTQLLRGQPVPPPPPCEIRTAEIEMERRRRPLFGAKRTKGARRQEALKLPEGGFALEVQVDRGREKRRRRDEAEAVEQARQDADARQRSLFGFGSTSVPRTMPCTPAEAGMILMRAAIKSELLKKRECRLLYRRAYVQAAKAIDLGADGGIDGVRDCDALARAREAFRMGQACERSSR